MSTHTQGNWILHDPVQQRRSYGHRDKRIMVLHPDGERLIACCSTGTTSKAGSIPREERLANARLIAAAPELLVSLKRLSFAALCRDNTQGDPSRLIEAKAELFDAAQEAAAAIAKAIGECPACNAPPNGPIPAYCPEHDGDYSAWLVSNNID